MNRLTGSSLFADTLGNDNRYVFGKRSDISVKKGLTNSPVEASGILYLEDLKEYIVISDDTDMKEPALFIMDSNNHVYKKVKVIGVKKINDIEGITQDQNGIIYLLASQSFNRKGKQPESRKLLVKVSRTGVFFQAQSSVRLFDLLKNAALNNENGVWEKFILTGVKDKSIDIEGITWWRGSILLGFKNPKLNNRAVILKIEDPDNFFANNSLKSENVSLWKQLALYDESSATFCGISDLLFFNDDILGTATGIQSRHGLDVDVGLLWRYSTKNDRVDVFKSFSGLKPEGITYNKEKKIVQVVFDNGVKNRSQIMKVKVTL